jgi:hypothetical protein
MSLDPCPFCGGKPYLHKEVRISPDVPWWRRLRWRFRFEGLAYSIYCNSCAAHGGRAKSESGARRMWQARQAQPYRSFLDAGLPEPPSPPKLLESDTHRKDWLGEEVE